MLGGTEQPPRPPLYERGSGDGEVVEEGFVQPLAGLVSRPVIGLVARRTEAGRGGGEAQGRQGDVADLFALS
jgi:hypothetical protein